MRAKFVRGEDPKKSLGIGKYSIIWGKIEDLIREELKDMSTYYSSLKKEHSDPHFFISRDRNRMGIYFPHADEFIIHQLFQIMNTRGIFQILNTVLQAEEGEGKYIGVNIRDPEYFAYNIPDELFIEGQFMEFYIVDKNR
jgi:hypothetical protein